MSDTASSLQPYNTLQLPCHAYQLQTIQSPSQARELLQSGNPPDLILGGGSNVVLAQPELGQVWLNRIPGREVLQRDSGHVRIRLGAGENWDAAVAWSLEQAAYGLENLSLIPGLCGAAPIQNIGAYGVELSDFVDCVEALDLRSGEVHRLSREDCRFRYRGSIFRDEQAGRWLIIAIELALRATPQPRLEYPGIREQLAQDGQNISAETVRAAVIAIRQAKLPDPAVLGNVGSFFKNPLINPSQLEQLLNSHDNCPHWPQTDGRHKVSAAWLIDRCGFKGYRQGDAGVHQNHALVLVNHGQASGNDILQLARHIQVAVKQRFAIELEPEPVIIE
ncbi:MAG: UDP-N-acetylmuramate dehydrogenase [Wenzhouxiangellaceae bacterium]